MNSISVKLRFKLAMFSLILMAIFISFVSCKTISRNESLISSVKLNTNRSPAAGLNPRGASYEYDAGPPKDSKWPDIFAETPDYRSYGKAIYRAAAEQTNLKDDGQEKFRWKVGPMWYRGRLTPESVKVFVIGQEGAQDENVSNRTFTGSTGTKMQNFLNYLGIDRSYLFMNTFLYTITGQYTEMIESTDTDEEKKQKKIRSKVSLWLAQNPESVIVQHRHRMFDYMLSQNKNMLKLIIGVGAAGKDSLATWIKSHGGRCSAKELSSGSCDASVIAPGAKAIGVMHPGAASARNGGANAAGSLQVQFTKKADLVASWIKEDSEWLKPDTESHQIFDKFIFKDAPIPHRDFAFGTNFRMGKDGTTTNRRGADGIQIYSDAGCYNNMARIKGRCDKNKSLNVKYEEPTDIGNLPKMSNEDFPWESPKSIEGRREYDSGPDEFASVLTQHWPDFTSLGITSHSSFGYSGLYRGNLKNPKVVILADQESNDDLFSGRALTGTGGQRLQTLLNAMNLKNEYVVLRTLPVDSSDLSIEKIKQIATNNDVVKTRNLILDKIIKQGKTKLFISIGEVANSLIPGTYSLGEIPIVQLESPLSKAYIKQWQSIFSQLSVAGITVPRTFSEELSMIPRADLPVHTRWWMGTSGTRTSRAFLNNEGKKEYSGDYYQFNAPSWVNSKNYPANPQSLESKEKDPYREAYQNSLMKFKNTFVNENSISIEEANPEDHP